MQNLSEQSEVEGLTGKGGEEIWWAGTVWVPL
jgi:hypothetical protein